MSTFSFAPYRRVVLAYGVLSFLWILLSDRAVDWVFPEPSVNSAVQTWKGWFFVLVTSALLYVLLLRVHRQMRRTVDRHVEALQREAHAATLLSALANGSSDAMFAKDRSGKYLFVNREAARVTGRAPEDVLGHDDSVLFAGAQLQMVQANDARVMEQARVRNFEEELDTQDGRLVFRATKGPLLDERGQVIGLFGVSRDVTETVAIRQALEHSEQRYRHLFDAHPQPMWVCDVKSLQFLAVNRAAEHTYGYSRDEFLGMTQDDIHPAAQLDALHRELSRSEKWHSGLDQLPALGEADSWLHRCKDGRLIEVAIATTLIEFNGAPARLMQMQDMTLRNRQERERDQAQRKWRDVLGRITDGFVSIDLDHRFAYVNHKVVQLSGCKSASELEGRRVRDLFPCLVGSSFQASYFRAVESGQPVVVEDWFEDQARWIEMRFYPSAQGVSVCFNDVTVRKLAELEVERSRRELLSLTQLLQMQEREANKCMAQVLHDRLGQQLGSARLYLDVAREGNGSDTPARGKAYAHASALLDAAIGEVRHVLQDLRPPLLDNHGLAAALDNHLRMSPAQAMGLQTELEVGSMVSDVRWPATVEFAAFMVAREAVTNALRHAQATFIKVSLDGDADHLSLRVEDDGQGIQAADHLEQAGHLGLVGMKERAAAIRAALRVDGRTEGGTVVELTWERSDA